MCKHVLAVKLAAAFGPKTEGQPDSGLLDVKIIEDNDWASLLLSSKSHLQKYETVRSGANKKSN